MLARRGVRPEAADVDYVLRRGAVEAPAAGGVCRAASPARLRDLATPAGQAYELRLEPADAAADPCPENNVARFLVQTTGGKPLLCFPASPASRLPALLAKGGVAVETLPPASFDGSLATLAGYSGVVIENVRADAFGRGPLENIAAWIEHAGAGLAMTGGRNAFGIGGYYKSPLEDILPSRWSCGANTASSRCASPSCSIARAAWRCPCREVGRRWTWPTSARWRL